MYCTKCGAENEATATQCVKCGSPLSGATGAPITIQNYLVPSILVTLCCCLPLGIASIIFAAQVNGKVAAGDVQGAMDYSRKAKTFCWLSFGFGLVAWILYLALSLIGGMAEH